MNNTEKMYRHEYKYIISDIQIEILQQKLNTMMRLDSNAKESGHYYISSLYFDDCNNSCLYDNINGVDAREKYRIRIYNNNPTHMYLECKCKRCGMTRKTTAEITADVYDDIVLQKNSLILQQTPIVRRMAQEIQIKHMKPVVIVSYERIPYICTTGNVRITIDRNLSSSSGINNFLTGDYIRRPVMPSGLSLLEVKWDSFIPDEIYHITQMNELLLTSYSKYVLCRKMGV